MSDFSTADLYDRYEDALAVCAPIFRDFGGLSRFYGEAVTVKCVEDNSPIKTALAQPGRGRVLVADCGMSVRCAMLGDLIAASAVRNGWAGVVLTAAVRDTQALAAMTLGIKALAANPRKSVRRESGQRDLAIEVAGVLIQPGDWVYADADGIVVSQTALDLPSQ